MIPFVKLLGMLRNLAANAPDSRTTIAIISCCGLLGNWLVGYVDAKHIEGVARIASIEKTLSGTQLDERERAGTLKSIEKDVQELRRTLSVMDRRLWQVYKRSGESRVIHDEEEE